MQDTKVNSAEPPMTMEQLKWSNEELAARVLSLETTLARFMSEIRNSLAEISSEMQDAGDVLDEIIAKTGIELDEPGDDDEDETEVPGEKKVNFDEYEPYNGYVDGVDQELSGADLDSSSDEDDEEPFIYDEDLEEQD